MPHGQGISLDTSKFHLLDFIYITDVSKLFFHNPLDAVLPFVYGVL